MDGCYSKDYSEAREKFVAAARAASAQLSSFVLEQNGPAGESLSTDVAWLGPRDARDVMVTISATHGVEGFFGSAVQIEWLRRGEAASLTAGTAALHIHALNPYGFAWLRRTNEDNVDVNRNWISFDKSAPANSLYDELSDDLCPSDWSPESQARTGARLAAWIQRHNVATYKQAVTGGQWTHSRGLFYGGKQPSWSRRTLTEIITSTLGRAERVRILDFHTGLGPYGYAEPIVGRPRRDPGFARTAGWIGAAAKSLYGESVSSKVQGDGMSMMPSLLPDAQVDVLALECGIRPINEVEQALRADAWLHAYGDPRSLDAKLIKAMMRAAFHADEPLWQGMALGQGLAACRAAAGSLSDRSG
jgi:hypothetical protein